MMPCPRHNDLPLAGGQANVVPVEALLCCVFPADSRQLGTKSRDDIPAPGVGAAIESPQDEAHAI